MPELESDSEAAIFQEALYSMTASRFARIAADSEIPEAEGELTLEELQRFVAVHLEPMVDPATWHAELTNLLTVEEGLAEALEQCAISILDALDALISRYAIIWAHCGITAMLAEQPPEPRDSGDGRDALLASMEDALSELGDGEAGRMRLLMNRPTGDFKGASKDGKVTAVCRRDDLLDGMSIAFGGSNFNMSVVNIKPFRKRLLKDPAYMRNVIEAVNVATDDCRTMLGTKRSLEDVEAEREAEMARIEAKHPEFWGCHGVGSIFTALGVVLCEREVLRDPDEEPFSGTDVLRFLEDGWSEFVTLQRTLEAALDTPSAEGTASPQETLREVAALRQFFLCSLGSPEEFPDEMVGIAQKVYRDIKKEVTLDKNRREANLQSTSGRWRAARRMATLAAKKFEVSSECGKIIISGAGRLEALEDLAPRTSKQELLDLLNAAFERCSLAHRSVSGLMDIIG